MTISNYHREMYEKYKEVQDYVLNHLPDDDIYTDRGDCMFVAGVAFFRHAGEHVFGDLQAEEARREQFEALKKEFEGDAK